MKSCKKTLFMETTKIDPSQTVGQIQQILGEYGASAILMEYDGGNVSGMMFKLLVEDLEIPFRLPCRWEAIRDILQSRKRRGSRGRPQKIDPAIQARRIAWRQILRWVEAQLALVDTGMVKMQEIFMPYLLIGQKETLFEKFEQTKYQIEYKEKK
jgi:hypothetical protein